jgi:hypothetical protein
LKMSNSSPLYLILPFAVGLSACANWESRSEDYWPPDEDLPPALTLELPVDGHVFEIGDEVRLVGTASDVTTPWDQLTVTADSDRDGNLASLNPGTDGRFDMALTVTSEGAHNLTVTAIDESGLQSSLQVTFSWGENLAPSAPVVEILPLEAESDDSLTASILIESVDPEADAITYLYAWSKDGVLQEDLLTEEVPEGMLVKNEVWSLSVTASDGVNLSEPATDEITISDALPEVSVHISPESPTASDTLVCEVEASDPDGDEITLIVSKWSVNGTYKQNAAEPFSDDFSAGDVVRCVSTATSISGSQEGWGEVTIAGGSGAPVVQSATIAGDLPVSETSTSVRCDVVSSDPDGDPLTHTINWIVNGTTAAMNTDEADSSFYVKGDELQCGATASDGANLSVEVLSAIEIVANSAPTTISSVSLSPSAASVGDSLSCTLGSSSADPDGDTVTYEYYWFVNSTKDASQNLTNPIDTSGYSSGDAVKCAVRPHDGTTNGKATYSAELTLAAGQGDYGPADADLGIFGSTAGARMGRAVFNIGDMDADGADELAVSGYGYDSNRGIAFIYLGSTLSGATTDLSDTDADAGWWGEAQGDLLGAGENVGSGSFDSDGRPDFIASAHKNNANNGKVYVLLTGDYTNWATTYIDDAASFMVEGDTAKSQMVGYGFGSGDLDGDGAAELIVGAPKADVPKTDSGYVGVFLGTTISGAAFGTTEAISDADYLFTGMDKSDGLGDGELTVIPDIDGDGYDELAVGGTNMNSSGTASEGSLFLVSGADLADGKISDSAFMVFYGDNASDDMGISATSPGDLDNDGTPDLLIGARTGDENVSDAGAVYFYYGDSTWSGSKTASTADGSWGDDKASALFGKHVAADQDHDGDGTNDILIGAHAYDNYSGRSYLISGGDHASWVMGMDISTQAEQLYTGGSGDLAGIMSAFIDADGDGLMDLAIGADGDDNGANQGGGVIFLFGN